MRNRCAFRAWTGLIVVAGLVVPAAASQASAAHVPRPQVTLTQVSSDPYHTGGGAVHATEIEPDTYTFGSTIVAAFMVGDWSAIGWAASTDGGSAWQHGFLPITAVSGGTFGSEVFDPSVAYDPRHKVWLISALENGTITVDTSPDGLTWSKPVTVVSASGVNKDWITCDVWPQSPHYGNCYDTWDDVNSGSSQPVQVSTSTDGGQAWGNPQAPPDNPGGLGGQPVVQPNGDVVVPYVNNAADTRVGQIRAYMSTNGGASWNASVLVANVKISGGAVPGGSDDPRLPSAQVDGGGNVYVAWEDCSFRPKCSENDIVMSTSANGTVWSPVKRIPIAAAASTVDAFLPGIGADRTTSGSGAHLGLYYDYDTNGHCKATACRESAGFISSTDGGSTWSAPTTVAGPWHTSWMIFKNGGWMGEYQGCGFANGKAFSVFPVAKQPVGTKLNVAMYAVQGR